MAVLTPQIMLTASLESIVGAAAVGRYLRVALCGYGPQPPPVSGTCMLADAGVPQLVGPQENGTPISIELFGNDVIAPPNTFYEISVPDQNLDVIQSAMYQLTGSGTFDLSQLAPILPPFNLGFLILTMRYMNCNAPPRVPASVFIAPGPALAVAYNGVPLGSEHYTIEGSQINLTFTTELGDRIDAFCIVQ
jgi:hypothetical protein